MDRYEKKIDDYEKKLDRMFRQERTMFWSRIAFLFVWCLFLASLVYVIYYFFSASSLP
ncbi:MAG: hypothetical protein VW378_02510 [bacterium]